MEERESGTGSAHRAIGTASGNSGEGRAGDFVRRFKEARFVLSLALVPGAAHVYHGNVARGITWACAFLLVVLPLSFFLFFAWAFSERALFWTLVGAGTFLLLGGIGPALRAFRGPGPPPQARRRTRGVAVYACVVALAVVVESGWFAFHNLSAISVTSAALEPIAREGEDVTVLLSRFTRPVHGEVILFALGSRPESPGEEPPHRLGRVIAVPRDVVALQSGEVFVNEIRIDFGRTDQRRALEKAGRRLRRKRLLSELFSPASDLSAFPERTVSLEGKDWSVVLPADVYLVAPDVNLHGGSPEVTSSGVNRKANGEDSGAPPVPAAWMVDRSDVLGRAIPRLLW